MRPETPHRLLTRRLLHTIVALPFSVTLTGQMTSPPFPATPLPAQAPAAATQAPATPTQAIDPLLTRPVGQLAPEQVIGMQHKLADWPDLAHYREENSRLPPPEPGRVVFFGDSITLAWKYRDNNVFFPGKPYLDRGISAQTTPQMLVRFQQDVVALKPAVVVILGGINDLAGNTGASTQPMIEANFRSMVAIAQASGIRVVLSSVLPASDFPWRHGLSPAGKVRALNVWLRQYAAERHCVYLDYYSALVDNDGGMKPGLSKDGVHPTAAGYAIMTPLAQAAIDRALRQK